jgi:hypothetical protein
MSIVASDVDFFSLAVAWCSCWDRPRDLLSLPAHWSLFCTVVLILISLAQPSDQFVCVGSFLLWRSADFSSLLEILAKRPYECSRRSFYDDLVRFSSRSWHKDLDQTVWKSLWEGFVEILVKSSKSSLPEDLENLLFWRCLHEISLGRFLEKDLARRGPYIKTVNTPASESS